MPNANQLLSCLLLASYKMNFCNYYHMQLLSTKKRNSGFFSSLHLIEGILRQKPYWKDSGDEGSTSEIMIGRKTTSAKGSCTICAARHRVQTEQSGLGKGSYLPD